MVKKKETAKVVSTITSVDQLNNSVLLLGSLQRTQATQELELQERIATISAEYSSIIEVKDRITDTVKDIKLYCDENREQLLLHATGKTLALSSGTVQWRTLPRSLEFRKGKKVEDVVLELHEKCMIQFIRTKEEPNKELMLERESEELVAALVTCYVRKDVEEFSVTPIQPKV